jgi:hypothetical protein
MDPRKILGVDHRATKEEITRAYREKIRKHHPDLGGDTWAFQQVQQAYESLITPESPPQPTAPQPNPDNAVRRRNDDPKPSPRSSTNSDNSTQGQSEGRWWHLFLRQLPLQNETTIFILVNVFDIFMTYILLRFGAMESNPIANYFFQIWGFRGMLVFKLSIVTFVCVVAQVVAFKKIRTARFLLMTGTLITGAVVVYSALLFCKHFT